MLTCSRAVRAPRPAAGADGCGAAQFCSTARACLCSGRRPQKRASTCGLCHRRLRAQRLSRCTTVPSSTSACMPCRIRSLFSAGASAPLWRRHPLWRSHRVIGSVPYLGSAHAALSAPRVSASAATCSCYAARLALLRWTFRARCISMCDALPSPAKSARTRHYPSSM